MKPLEAAILSFDSWSLPWTFFSFVINNHSLTNKDKELFRSIWLTAIDSENWKNSNLEKGSKLTESRLKQLYKLTDNTVSNIIRAASYQWK